MNNENNDKSSIELPNIPIFHYFNQIHSKDQKSTKEKVSGPDPSNHYYIHYSDIKIQWR